MITQNIEMFHLNSSDEISLKWQYYYNAFLISNDFISMFYFYCEHSE